MSTVISRDEWLSAFHDALGLASQDAGAATVGEIAESLGLHDHRRVRVMMKALIQAGEAEVVMVRRTMINGVTRHLPAYRLMKPSVQ